MQNREARGMPASPRPGLAPGRLKTFNQVADAQRICFTMAVARNWIGTSAGLNHNVRPNHSRRNLHRSYLGDRNALFVAAEETLHHAAHAKRADHDECRKPEVP